MPPIEEPMVKWVKSKIFDNEDARKCKIHVNNINQALDKLRDVIREELNHSKAEYVNMDLVKKLREVEKEIRENL